jgi:hypothetical protein
MISNNFSIRANDYDSLHPHFLPLFWKYPIIWSQFSGTCCLACLIFTSGTEPALSGPHVPLGADDLQGCHTRWVAAHRVALLLHCLLASAGRETQHESLWIPLSIVSSPPEASRCSSYPLVSAAANRTGSVSQEGWRLCKFLWRIVLVDSYL